MYDILPNYTNLCRIILTGMFKFIHTSDWHLGQIFSDYDRTAEHMAFFGRLKEIVSEEKPDALLVSGDIYHNSMPSAATQRLYTDAVLDLKNACPGMTVVVTAGNHDSPSRLEIDSNLWNRLGVKVLGSLSRREGKPEADRHIIEIHSASGSLAGYVIALPHIYVQNYPVLRSEELCSETGKENIQDTASRSGTARQRAFYKYLLDRVAEKNTDSVPVVIMAHLAVSGCDISGHDESAGGMEYTPLDTFPDGWDYLALGHIHHPQIIGMRNLHLDSIETSLSAPVARYSGSPLPVSFDENYRHSVSIVELSGSKEHRAVKVREAVIPASVPVVTLPADPVPFEEALEALRGFPDDMPAYIRLNVKIRDFLPQNASLQAMHVAAEKELRYCGMKVTRENAGGNDTVPRLSVDEFKTSSPVDIAKLYYRQRFGGEIDPELENMIQGLSEEEIRESER